MRIAFFASPEFALPCYQALVNSAHVLAVVVTRPDKPKGRSKKLQPTLIKERAVADQIPVLTPEKLGCNFREELRTFTPDVLVVVAYGRIISDRLLEEYQGRVINIHPSLLPKLRGASPILNAILQGFEKTGVTLMHLAHELDAGDILLQREHFLTPRINADALHDELATLSADLLLEGLDLLEKDQLTATAQNHQLATMTKPLFKEDGRINWQQSAEEIDRHIRAFHAWPGAWTMLGDNVMKIHEATPVTHKSAKPGEILSSMGDFLLVACGENAIQISRLQPATRKIMDTSTYLRGTSLAEHQLFF
jgi:methionyl-tRNA formyltransferase